MIAKRIAGATHFPGAPKDWNPDRDGNCGHLAVRVTLDGERLAFCESAWEPTPREIEMLQRGGQIVLRVYGWQVPVALNVEPPAEPVTSEIANPSSDSRKG